MRLISPPSIKGHQSISTIIDYFSKWAKTVSLRKVEVPNVVQIAISTKVSISMAFHDELSTTVDHNSLVFLPIILHSLQNSTCVINCALRVCNCLAKAFNQTDGKSLKTETTNLADASGALYHGQDTNKSDAIPIDLWSRSHATIGGSDSSLHSRPDNLNDR